MASAMGAAVMGEVRSVAEGKDEARAEAAAGMMGVAAKVGDWVAAEEAAARWQGRLGGSSATAEAGMVKGREERAGRSHCARCQRQPSCSRP